MYRPIWRARVVDGPSTLLLGSRCRRRRSGDLHRLVQKNADRFREEFGGEATFVAMLARCRLIDRLRKSHRELESQPIDELTLQHAAPPHTSPAELAEEAARAAACVERLRKDERKVLELSIYHGLPQTQIAEQTGLALGTVKTMARRGLLQLRDCMQVRHQQRSRGVEVV